jgi:hypothetical protein
MGDKDCFEWTALFVVDSDESTVIRVSPLTP